MIIPISIGLEFAKMLSDEFRAANAARRAFAGRPFVGFKGSTNLQWINMVFQNI